MYNNNISQEKSQVLKILTKAQIKKQYNEKVIDYLTSVGKNEKAQRIKECGTFIGVTLYEDVPHVVKGNFCRERLCNICAWRRQSRFIAQMLPTLNNLSTNYNFLFITLTIKNETLENLKNAVDTLSKAYDRFLKRSIIKKTFKGVCRSTELTYNHTLDNFHPHMHLLIAVKKEYFKENYITQKKLSQIWKECLQVDYTPVVDIRKVTDDEKAVCETLKYSLKPSQYENSLKAFDKILKGRRLISFSGVFAEERKKLKYSSFEEVLTDTEDIPPWHKINYNLYKFDVTGGIYKFYETYSY